MQTRAYMYNIKSGKDFRLVYPLQLEPSSKVQYYEVINNKNLTYTISIA